MVNGSTTTENATKGNAPGQRLHFRHLNIGPRLTACFLIIVSLMGTADFVAAWQFRRIEVPAHRFYQVDQKSLAVMRIHLDLMEFREGLGTLANAQDQRKFAVEAASRRDHVVQDVQRAEETLKSFPYLNQNVAITLEAVGTSLAQQADVLVQLANVGDWRAVRLRLANQVRAIVGLTSRLASDVDQEVTQERAQALASTQRARDQLALVLSATAALTLLIAIVLGWRATRSITGPLSALDRVAKALGGGDFQHQIEVQGEDELARLGTAFNYATRQVRVLYDELKRNEARFRALIEHSSDLIMILDRSGTIRYVSPASIRLTGRTQDKLQGHDFTDFLLSEDVPKFRAALRGARDKAGAPVQISFRCGDGSLAALELMANDLFDEPAVAGVVVNARDITERKRAEDALREAQAGLAHVTRVTTMGELTASLAHELRQPIAAAMTNARTCLRWLDREQPDIEEAREATSRVINDTARASEIISRIGSIFKKGEPKRELVDLNTIIEEIILLLQNEAHRHSLSIRTKLAPGLPRFSGDRILLQQVIMNLVLNAIDAMENVGAPASLTITSQQQDGGQLFVSVSDMGKGLPSDQADQIFNAFFTTKPHGTGMGLTISRSIIESHGGRLWATSNSGPGTTFYFSLPGAISEGSSLSSAS
jgi:PAS domain S-box-containing protein